MQRLTLTFRSKESFNKVYIRKMSNARFGSAVARNYAASLSHWITTQYAYEEAQIDNHSLNRPYAVYKVTVFAERDPKYYILKMILIVLITTVMSFLGFYTPLADIGSRLEFLVSILLTNIAFTYSVNQELPKIGYYTQLDYMFTSGIFAPFLAGCATGISYFWERDKIECDRKQAVRVTDDPIYDTENGETRFGDLSCPDKWEYNGSMDTWFFRALLVFYLCVWLYFYRTWVRIHSKIKQTWTTLHVFGTIDWPWRVFRRRNESMNVAIDMKLRKWKRQSSPFEVL